jgi:hypothetical protein
MMQDGLVSFTSRGSRLLWRLQIWRCVYDPAAPGAIRSA